MRVDRVYSADPSQMRWGSGPLPQAGVCFFDDTNFRGQYFCVRPGENVAQMPGGMNDKISSLRVIGNVEVMVFRDVRFRGPSGRFLTDVRDLRREGCNDQISSIRLISAGGVLIFVDRDFGGGVARFTSDVPDLRRGGWNDTISSIRVY